jgi:hypothetical protein
MLKLWWAHLTFRDPQTTFLEILIRRSARSGEHSVAPKYPASELKHIKEKMSPDFIASAAGALKLITAVIAVVAALFGLAGWYFSAKDAKLKADALEKFQFESAEKTADANKQAALANERAAAAIKHTEELRNANYGLAIKLAETQKRLMWRRLDARFNAAISQASKGTVEIVYKKDDSEAYSFAESIKDVLVSAGWIVDGPTYKVPTENRPFMLGVAGISGNDFAELALLVGTDEPTKTDESSPLGALVRAFQILGITPMVTMPHETLRPKPGIVRIVVGSRL